MQVQYYQRAIHRDNYLAIAFFQQGVSNFLVGDFEEAMANFNDALRFLRGNRFINYEQLGLKFRLYSCEVLFNRGLCSIYIQQKEAGMEDLNIAAKEKEKPDHDVIDEAISEQAEVTIEPIDIMSTGSCLIGVYSLLNSCWSNLPAKCCQGEEPQV